MELEIRGLGKRYGKKTAVSGVELTITPGVWGLIGANGAGKTTLMRMLAGILTPSAGRVLYDGVDIRDLGEAYRDALGFHGLKRPQAARQGERRSHAGRRAAERGDEQKNFHFQTSSYNKIQS